MREIKFRAWCYVEKKMYEGVIPMPGGVGFYDDVSKGAYQYVDGICSEPMQFTGLKDKNGKEIYEGDVLDCGDIDDPYWVVFWCDEIAGWKVKGPSDGYVEQLCEVAPYDDVIGNIYETPELLETTA